MTNTVYNIVQTNDPTSPAICASGRAELTYGGLLHQIIRTKEKFSRNNITHNDRVAIVLPNGPEMATAFFSIASFSEGLTVSIVLPDPG